MHIQISLIIFYFLGHWYTAAEGQGGRTKQSVNNTVGWCCVITAKWYQNDQIVRNAQIMNNYCIIRINKETNESCRRALIV